MWNFDNAGDLDMVVLGADNIRFGVGNGDGSFAVDPPIAVGDDPQYFADVDLDNDGYRDLVVSNNGGDSVMAVMNELGSLVAQNEIDVEDQPRGVAAADLDGDTFADIVVANRQSDTISVILQDPGSGWHEPVSFDVDDAPTPVLLADFDGDELMDLVVGHQGNVDRVDIRLGLGDGSFGAPQQFPAGNEPISFALGDLNEDSVLDVVVCAEMSDELIVIQSDP